MEILNILAETIQKLNESVYQHNIVVRWENGDLEGFSGTALSGARKAKESAEAKASRKAAMIKKAFTILDHKAFSQLDSAQKKRLKRDWELSQKMDESKETNLIEAEENDEDAKKTEDEGIENEHHEQVKKGYGLLSDLTAKIEDYIDETKRVLARDKEGKYGKKLKVFLSVFEKLNKFIEDAHYNNKINSLMRGNLSEAEEGEQDNNEPISQDTEEFRKNEREVAKELVASLSVFLFAVENIFKQEFASAKDAEDFIFSAFRSIKSREVDVLRNMLRRFDKVGGERMANLFRRTLNRNLMK